MKNYIIKFLFLGFLFIPSFIPTNAIADLDDQMLKYHECNIYLRTMHSLIRMDTNVYGNADRLKLSFREIREFEKKFAHFYINFDIMIMEVLLTGDVKKVDKSFTKNYDKAPKTTAEYLGLKKEYTDEEGKRFASLIIKKKNQCIKKLVKFIPVSIEKYEFKVNGVKTLYEQSFPEGFKE